MTITELCKSAHDNAVNKGFYENPGSIDEHLMLIISELSEALEADRKDKHCKIDITKEPLVMLKLDFEELVKDTFEAEISDTFIRLFDFCGWLNITITQKDFDLMHNRTMLHFADISSLLLLCVRVVADMQDSGKDKYNSICCAFGYLFDICSKLEIDIEKYIMLTMAYNKTRPYKHGKKY